ncbi:MAG TPA: hypothetical protein EYG92_09005 [Lutibacter sp.]|nr:hypothetical protein [Lutibacter sp.]
MNHSDQALTPNGFLKTLRILHLALVTGVSVFLIFVYTQNTEWILNLSDTNDIFFFIVPAFAIFGVYFGTFLYKKQLTSLVNKDNLREKLVGFQTASIIKYATIEAPALLGILASFLNGNVFYILISSVLLVYLFFQKPTKDKIEMDLNLKGKLKSQFGKGDEVIE